MKSQMGREMRSKVDGLLFDCHPARARIGITGLYSRSSP